MNETELNVGEILKVNITLFALNALYCSKSAPC